MTGRRRKACALVAALILAACSPSDSIASTSVPERTTSTAASATTRTPDETTTAPPSTTTTVGATTTTGLRGEPVEGGPSRGAVLWVVGVAHDDVLNLRVAPGADQKILEGIPPTDASVLALGQTRALPAWWTKVEYGGLTGWVNLAYLAYVGATSDITSSILDETGGTLEAETMTEMGVAVADAVASEDPPSDIVLVVAESLGDLGEVTYDVIGLGDDSVRGLRLHVFGAPADSGFSLMAVESTVLCQPNRGVDDDGLCT